MKPTRFVLEIPALPVSNPSVNRHWRAKVRDRAEWALRVKAALGRLPKLWTPIEHARVEFVRHSSREPDGDNLVAGMKLVRDLLQPDAKGNRGGVGLIKSDAPGHIEATYRWEKAPPKLGRVTITVEEIDAAAAPLGSADTPQEAR